MIQTQNNRTVIVTGAATDIGFAVADAVLYLASAKWVTGVILPVDGGVIAGGDGTSRLRLLAAERQSTVTTDSRAA